MAQLRGRSPPPGFDSGRERLLVVLILAPRYFLRILWLSSLHKHQHYFNLIWDPRATGLLVVRLFQYHPRLVKQSGGTSFFIAFELQQSRIFQENMVMVY